jgi:uncharacterized protein DUF429
VIPSRHDQVATVVRKYCQQEKIQIVLIDGPQGWKDTDSPLQHCRQCERILNTPAKTGTTGVVMPRTYRRFVEFSIDVFRELVNRGASLALEQEVKILRDRLLVLESFPLSA